ncbi:hypothetical protein [Singulisphaera sp. PoT]|uniref:hypothetical protein n=1 Tax=Singulisphaera sp. PoT TaxID=3411797 RepID=UPI003BF4E83F
MITVEFFQNYILIFWLLLISPCSALEAKEIQDVPSTCLNKSGDYQRVSIPEKLARELASQDYKRGLFLSPEWIIYKPTVFYKSSLVKLSDSVVGLIVTDADDIPDDSKGNLIRPIGGQNREVRIFKKNDLSSPIFDGYAQDGEYGLVISKHKTNNVFDICTVEHSSGSIQVIRLYQFRSTYIMSRCWIDEIGEIRHCGSALN